MKGRRTYSGEEITDEGVHTDIGEDIGEGITIAVMDWRQPGHWERSWHLDMTYNIHEYSIADTVTPAKTRVQR